MTNEELVKAIQQGRDDLIPELWEQIEKYITWSANRYIHGYPEHYKFYVDDCINNGYFAVLKAARSYNPIYGTFTNYLKVPLRSSFREAIFCGKGVKTEHDPINEALSLDEPLTASTDETFIIADIAADKEAGTQTCYVVPRDIDDLEKREQWQTIHAFLEKGLKRSDNAGNKILLYMMNNDCKYSEAVTALYGIDEVNSNSLRWHKNAAMKRLKRYVIAKHQDAEKLGLNGILNGGLRKYGLQPFKERCFTSAVEYMAIQNANRKLH